MTKFWTLFIAIAAFAQARAVLLQSADTAVILEAAPGGPQLSRLALAGGPGWDNRASEELINQVEVNGAVQRVQWQVRPSASHTDPTSVTFVYESESPRLRLYWEWRVRAAHGPIEHSIRIENLGETEVWLPLQDSIRFQFDVPREQSLRQFWVEKGASSPSAEGTHNDLLQEGDHWTGTSSTYAHPAPGSPREMIPYLLVHRADGDQSGWYLGIEFSGRTRITLHRKGSSVSGEAGLNPNPGPYRTRVAAGESFETPPVFLGAFKDGPDGAGILSPAGYGKF